MCQIVLALRIHGIYRMKKCFVCEYRDPRDPLPHGIILIIEIDVTVLVLYSDLFFLGGVFGTTKFYECMLRQNCHFLLIMIKEQTMQSVSINSVNIE